LKINHNGHKSSGLCQTIYGIVLNGLVPLNDRQRGEIGSSGTLLRLWNSFTAGETSIWNSEKN